MKIIITEEQFNRFNRSSGALQNGIIKYLNLLFSEGERTFSTKNNNFGSLSENWCIDGKNHFIVNYYFEDGKLISWITIGFYESKMRGKFWVISNFFSSVYTSYFNFNRPEFGMLFKAAFEVAEGRGYYQYFYSIAERLERVYERQWKKNCTPFYFGKNNAVVN